MRGRHWFPLCSQRTCRGRSAARCPWRPPAGIAPTLETLKINILWTFPQTQAPVPSVSNPLPSQQGSHGGRKAECGSWQRSVDRDHAWGPARRGLRSDQQGPGVGPPSWPATGAETGGDWAEPRGDPSLVPGGKERTCEWGSSPPHSRLHVLSPSPPTSFTAAVPEGRSELWPEHESLPLRACSNARDLLRQI